MFMPLAGISQGLQPILGFNHSAGKVERVRQAIRLTAGFTIVYGFVLLGICQIIPSALLKIFVSEQAVISQGSRMLRIISITLPLTGIGNIAAVYYQSTEKKRLAYFLPITGNLLISLPILFLLSHSAGLTGAMASLPVSDTLAFLLNSILLTYNIRKEKQKEK